MKKLAILAIVALSLAGCCSMTGPDGVVTTSFANCFQTSQYEVCNAPADVVAAADMVIAVLKPEAALLLPGSEPFIALVTAQQIKDTGCAALTSLNTLIGFSQTYNLKVAVAIKSVNMKVGAAKAIPIRPLENWRDSKAGK